MKKPIASPNMEESFIYEGKFKVYKYYGDEQSRKILYYDTLSQALSAATDAEHYEIEIMNVNIAAAILKDMLIRSNRIGSDEIYEIRNAINLLNKINLE